MFLCIRKRSCRVALGSQLHLPPGYKTGAPPPLQKRPDRVQQQYFFVEWPLREHQMWVPWTSPCIGPIIDSKISRPTSGPLDALSGMGPSSGVVARGHGGAFGPARCALSTPSGVECVNPLKTRAATGLQSRLFVPQMEGPD